MSPGSYSATSSAGVALSDGSGSLADVDGCPAASADAPMAPETNAFLFREFSDTTQKLQESHSALEQRVALLCAELNEKSHILERNNKTPEGLEENILVSGGCRQGAERVVKSPMTLSASLRECVISERRGAEIAPLFFPLADSTSSDKRASITKRALPLDLRPVRGDGMSFAIALSNVVGVEV